MTIWTWKCVKSQKAILLLPPTHPSPQKSQLVNLQIFEKLWYSNSMGNCTEEYCVWRILILNNNFSLQVFLYNTSLGHLIGTVDEKF